MATYVIQIYHPLTISYHNYHDVFENNHLNHTNRRCYAGCRSGGSNWDRRRTVRHHETSRFGNQYVTDNYDDEEEFGFRNAAKQRIWWSEEFYDRDEDDDDDKGFGILEGSIDFNWIFKVIRPLGWMLPAIIIPLLLGTGPNTNIMGPNTIIMAVALPLAQSALSLAANTLWGRSGDTWRPRSKSKKRARFGKEKGKNPQNRKKETRDYGSWTSPNQPGKKRTYSGATSSATVGKDKGQNPHTRKKETGDYRSWTSSNHVSTSDRGNFGGWDELDR